MADLAALALRLGRLRAERLDLRRARRADPCELAARHPADSPERWGEIPCFGRMVRVGAEDGAPMWSAAPELVCSACRRNGERAHREATVRREAGTVLATLARFARAQMEAPSSG